MKTPLPIKVSTLGQQPGLGQLTPDEAIAETQRLVSQANKRALEEMANVAVLPRPPRMRPMLDSDKVSFLFQHGRWPSPSEQEGYY